MTLPQSLLYRTRGALGAARIVPGTPDDQHRSELARHVRRVERPTLPENLARDLSS